ncbi:MAG TPA: immunoglobulin domain-containing protein, partial [Opitutaceae bacterium]
INSVSSNPGKQSSNLVNGLYYADAYGNIAQTEFNAALWWDLHNSENTDPSANNSSSLYGWRNFGCYDIITGTAFSGINDNTPLPTYYAAKLMTHWARGGDQIVSTQSNYNWLSAFSAKLADGTLAILVVNKNPTTDVTASISLNGYAGASNVATVYSYGKTNDAQFSPTPDLSVSTISNAGTSFSYTFPSYSMTVIRLSQQPTAAMIVTQPMNTAVSIGGTANFSVVAAGTGSLSYQWYKDGVPLSGQTSSTLTISNVQTSDFGSYDVVVSNSLGSVTSSAVTLSLATAHLSNVSMRAQVATGPATPIVGIIVSGSGTTPILVRALGPALLKQGLRADQILPDPALKFFDGAGHLIDQNNDWSSSIATQMAQYSAVSLDANSLDAAAIETLAPGGYTVHLLTNAGTGVGLLEMHSLDGQSAHLTNISARANVGTGANVLIAGFIVSGSGSMNVLVRGIGPSLTGRGVNGALADPIIKVYSGQTVIAQNDNWASDPNASATTAAIAKVNATALMDKEAAMVVTLSPGGYTVIESGVGNTTGVGLVEVFDAQ